MEPFLFCLALYDDLLAKIIFLKNLFRKNIMKTFIAITILVLISAVVLEAKKQKGVLHDTKQ